MPKFNVDVKAFINVTVEADDKRDARRVADAFVENAMFASEQLVAGYNEGLPKDAVGRIVPGEYGPSVDGTSEVERADEDDNDEGDDQ